MKRTAILLAVLVLFLAGCYDYPITKEHTIPIDPSLIGAWMHLNGKELDHDNRVVVLKFSKTEYLILNHNSKENKEMCFRGYPIKIGGISCLQLEMIGTVEGPAPNEPDPFVVVSYSVANNEELDFKFLNTDLVDTQLKSSNALKKAFLEHRDNKNLFTYFDEKVPVKYRRIRD
ncbi:MAG: hypothetical protein GY941_04640 [Planctomycetes bacterium]|nr:hypothetical protein [Planctomycetota bacterium]